MNILIYRTGRLGDFIVAVPAMNLIRRAYPDAKITLMTCASTKPAFAAKTWGYADPTKTLPWVDFVRPDIVDDVVCFSDLGSIAQLWALSKTAWRKKFETAFILPFTWETADSVRKKRLFLRMIGVRCPIHGSKSLVPRLDEVRHQVDSAISAAREAMPVEKVATDSVITYNLRVDPNAEQWAQTYWERCDLSGNHVIALFVGGSYEHKRWPLDHFREACVCLAQDSRIRFVLIGSQSERDASEAIAQTLPGKALNLCGETTLPQLAAVLRRCRVLVGNDSGPGHLAAALGCRTVTLMSGLYPPGIWEPKGASGIVLRHSVPCSPCRNETFCPTGTRACIDGIAVRDLLTAIRTLLEVEIPASSQSLLP
jgi:ADP-heptose:LPS heptosyltransferase